MFATALFSLGKPDYIRTVCFCPVHCPQQLTSTYFVHNVDVIHYSIFFRQLSPLCPTHLAILVQEGFTIQLVCPTSDHILGYLETWL